MADGAFKTKKWPQILVTFIVNLLLISCGATMCWPVPVFVPLLQGTTPIITKMTIKELDWVGSLTAVGAIAGALITGTLAVHFGKKVTLLFASMPFIISYVVIATTINSIQLYFCRFLSGISIGIAYSLFPIYTAEISEPSIRGMTTSTMQLSLCIGMMVPYGVGPFVSFTVLALVTLILPIIFFILFLFCPESPYALIAQNRRAEAIQSIRFLRGIKKEDEEYAIKEVDTIITYLAQSSDEPFKMADLCNSKANRKAHLIALFLVFFQQMSGINAIAIYMTKIFTASKSTLDPAYQTMIVGVVQVLSAAVTPPVVDRMGRKLILLISGAGMALSESLVGIYFVMMDGGMKIDNITFMPIVGMMSYTFFFCAGYGPVPWTVVGEIFSDHIRDKSATLCAAFAWFFAYLNMQFFSFMEKGIGFGGILLMYCVSDVCSVIFVTFIFKETKGKTLQEIQVMLEGAR